MSYAIEAKKRKFERILESLTDSTTSSSRTPLSARNNGANGPTSQISQPSVSDLSKRRRITPTSLVHLASKSSTSLSTHYLPSSRAAFLDRLETFRNVTRWHIPSTSTINAAEWAKRGWVCQDTDTVSCPSCKDNLLVDLDLSRSAGNALSQSEGPTEDNPEEEEDQLDIVTATYRNLVERYRGMIVDSHKEGCPWRRRGCDGSIQRIEGLLNAQNALTELESRYRSMTKEAADIPRVAMLPSSEADVVSDRELDALQFKQEGHLDINAVTLAVCGWQGKDADVVECRHCFRSLGLWLYRGEDPTMDHLDPIDSHLEYCPWRSARAQDTEVTTGKPPTRGPLPGWQLVYLAIVRENTKRRGEHAERHPTHGSIDETGETAPPDPELTPEQRERKMKDLLRRIRELKKPFSVKHLLRKKEKPDTIRR